MLSRYMRVLEVTTTTPPTPQVATAPPPKTTNTMPLPEKTPTNNRDIRTDLGELFDVLLQNERQQVQQQYTGDEKTYSKFLKSHSLFPDEIDGLKAKVRFVLNTYTIKSQYGKTVPQVDKETKKRYKEFFKSKDHYHPNPNLEPKTSKNI